MSMAYEEYMKEVVKPMRAELVHAGFIELKTEEEVHEFMGNVQGTTLVVINSVCGCAAGLARPSVTQAIVSSEKTPDQLVTVFAGQDREATQTMRQYFPEFDPSSPSMALLTNKSVSHFIPREQIEDHSMGDIIENLKEAFDKYC
jgi:putative YphP/YqiW family bacilliredoxin